MVQKHPRGAGVRTAPRFVVAEKVDPASSVGSPDRSYLLLSPPCPPLAAPTATSIHRVQSLAEDLRLQGSQPVTMCNITVE